MTSRPLFIIGRGVDEILRPITQFGCAQASSGVTSASVAGSRVRNGPPEAVRMILDDATMQRGFARQALENGVAVRCRPAAAAPRRCRARQSMKISARHHERFLVGEQECACRRARREARREAGRADDGRDHGVAPVALRHLDERLRRRAVTSVCAARVAQLAGDARRRVGVADHRDFRPEAQALLDELVAVAVRSERINRKALGMTRDDVERAVSNRARGTEQCQTFFAYLFL